MDIMDILVALIPVLSFGLVPVLGTLIGGKPVEQSMGISLGGLLFSVLVLMVRRPELNVHIFLIGFLSGVFWAVGSVGQFQGIKYLGVARATPILNGGQIIGTSLVGIMLGDWAGATAKVYGFIALALIIIGIVLTSYQSSSHDGKINVGRGIAVNLLAALGFTAYVGILKYYAIDSWSTIFPQSVGQVTAIAVFALLVLKTRPFTKISLRNSMVGIVWGIGNIALLLSQVKLGLATAYPISQAGVIVSVLGGVFINKEKKTQKEWIAAISGMAIISAGLYLIFRAGSNG